MVVSLEQLKKLQEKATIQEKVVSIEKQVDKRIKRVVLDGDISYKVVTVVVAEPNNTLWSGLPPLHLTSLLDYDNELVTIILDKLEEIYSSEGYIVTQGFIDIGKGESGRGLTIQIPNVVKGE